MTWYHCDMEASIAQIEDSKQIVPILRGEDRCQENHVESHLFSELVETVKVQNGP